ncbi:MAG TPA: phosphoenolpyruvate--protein phosphotransferase [Sedimenticola thiotaurini]|uniref:phosphoenolpyruvate--protein phosphotransferase n=1 Tax=Sedimenticola thiotaurini TaxID=1543721 RepID=A0A831W6K5_9GAMM|nr:phosphoenolpyruvate--protein phosphotransferase [Sedimenticola thiotaurini]
MLDVLHRIVQKVNAAPDLDRALSVIVQEVKQAIRADVCSVYLTDFEQRRHVLRATHGLRRAAVGRVSLPLHQGLVGLVCERAEPLNLDDAPGHPRYRFITETGEVPYHGFLGVPIIQNRQVLGVLVVRQRDPRRFADEEVSFLFTLAAQLAGAIVHARVSGELSGSEEQAAGPERFLQGLPGAAGVAIGRAVVVYREADLDAVPDRPAEQPEQEIALLHRAVARVREELRRLQGQMQETLPAEELALFDALLLMLSGDTLVTQTIERIQAGEWVQSALHHTVEEHAAVFERMEDAYLRERASDIRDLGRRILMRLQSEQPERAEYPDRTILVGESVGAVELAGVPRSRLAGVICAGGSRSSHVAILARAMGVPAVMGVTDLPVARMEGREVILDGYRGRVYPSPTPSVRREYSRLLREEQVLSAELEALRGEPAVTTDGVPMTLYLNTGLVSEMSSLGTSEAQGVGLYRTELPFMVRDRFPGEESQGANYRRVLETFAPRPVILRTLDVGGDKPLPYFPVQESNPFLGWRGIRISLDHPEIFLTQIRAMLRAAVGLGNLRIMLPMVTRISEVEELTLLIQRAHDELQEEGEAVTLPPVGVMVEVPALVYQIEALARRVDFVSVGSNDLTQYLLAVDRNNPRVAELYDELHPSVLRALQQVVDGARSLNRPVSVCGEMAGNPLAAVLLLGMGVESLSMSAASLLRIKWVIRSFSRSRARQLLQAALRLEEGGQVRQMMEQALAEVGLERLFQVR